MGCGSSVGSDEAPGPGANQGRALGPKVTASFLKRHAPNGQTWADYCGPVPPVFTASGELTGAWADCVYAGTVFELTNPGWDQLPEYADQGPVGFIIEFCESCGYASGGFEDAENRYREMLESQAQEGSRAFLRHKARNGQTWEAYLLPAQVQVDSNGYAGGAWGECMSAACIFEHENPAWNQLGPYSADGPCGQVLAFLQDVGRGDKEDALSRTEEATHQAINSGGRVPVFDASYYQVPVQIQPAATINAPPPAPSGRKRALLVGCNYPGSSAQLSGCVNDVRRWTNALQSLYGFDPKDMVSLTDEGGEDWRKTSTRENIVNGVRWLVGGAAEGDVLFFQFSGHGGQRECTDGSEADGMDEVLIPTDYKKAGVIVDHELFDLLVVPLPSGCKLTVILDCCHSGSALDLPFTWSAEQSKWEVDSQPWHTAGDVQMFSGCEDSQCSMDAKRQGKFGGAMTTAMCDVLEKVQGQGQLYTYPDLLARLKVTLLERGFEQNPRMSSSQPFGPEDKDFSLADGMVPNMNPTLGQTGRPPPKGKRPNDVPGFSW